MINVKFKESSFFPFFYYSYGTDMDLEFRASVLFSFSFFLKSMSGHVCTNRRPLCCFFFSSKTLRALSGSIALGENNGFSGGNSDRYFMAYGVTNADVKLREKNQLFTRGEHWESLRIRGSF